MSSSRRAAAAVAACRVLLATYLLTFSLHFKTADCRIGFSNCTSYHSVSNFQPDKYFGKWFENRRFFNVKELFGKCGIAKYYDITGADGVFKMGFNYKAIDGISGEVVDTYGSAVYAAGGNSSVADFIVNYDFNPYRHNVTNYSVVATDYTGYSVVYACTEEVEGSNKLEYMWLLTRDRYPNENRTQQVLDYLQLQGFQTQFFARIQQIDCPEIQ